jgi:DNA-binding winged helix-turn-helix (wHTH) protein
MSSLHWCFADFRVDPDNACLWRGAQVVPLTPKVFDVLHYLVSHADRLVSKDTLLDAVWPETRVFPRLHGLFLCGYPHRRRLVPWL